MAVDITLLFKASVKTVKTRNKALGVAATGDSARDELLKRGTARSKSDFTSRAREVVSAAPEGGRGAAGAVGSGSARAGSPPLTAASERLRGERAGPGVTRKEPRGSAFPHGCGLGARRESRGSALPWRPGPAPSPPVARVPRGAVSPGALRAAAPPARAALVFVRIRRPSGPCLRAHGCFLLPAAT